MALVVSNSDQRITPKSRDQSKEVGDMNPRRKINLQARLYEKMPLILRRPVESLRLFPNYLRWRYSKSGRCHAVKALGPLHNRFVGCRCIVMGNGPSLRRMDLSLLRDEFTFGLNRIYLLFDEIGFETSFLVSINRLMLYYYREEMASLHTFKIISWKYRGSMEANDKTVFLAPKPRYRMNGQVLEGYCPGLGTVTNLALELAYFMGFSEVILIGVDFSFKEKGVPNSAVLLQGADQNHFSPNYYEPGVVWQLPDYEAQKRGYSAAKRLFEGNGRRIVDATVGGKLQVFPKVDFESFLAQSGFMNKVSSMFAPEVYASAQLNRG